MDGSSLMYGGTFLLLVVWTETAVPGAYQQVCMTLPKRIVPLKVRITPHTIHNLSGGEETTTTHRSFYIYVVVVLVNR